MVKFNKFLIIINFLLQVDNETTVSPDINIEDTQIPPEQHLKKKKLLKKIRKKENILQKLREKLILSFSTNKNLSMLMKKS